MQGDPGVLQHLQAQLRNELTVTNQYFLHYRILKHWGFDRLAKKEYEESIGEMPCFSDALSPGGWPAPAPWVSRTSCG